MEELLGEDRASRSYRAKFPEEVLQESLAGQLWFGAECLAAGSSIMNRETESSGMRPLAKAVSKSLDNVRNLLRDKCLRHNSPNSSKLNLDVNDATTEMLYESLKIFDRLFAEFEFLYVSAMVQVKTREELEMQDLISVLFSESLQRALSIGLLKQEQVDSYDPALMFSIPRLAIVSGLILYSDGPLNLQDPVDTMSEMFKPFRKLLIKLRNLLLTLPDDELHQLEILLCTNEQTSKFEHFDYNVDNISNSNRYFESDFETNKISNTNETRKTMQCSKFKPSSNESQNVSQSTVNPEPERFLMVNSNIDNLFQPDMLTTIHSNNEEYCSDIHQASRLENDDSGLGTENTSLDRSPDYESVESNLKYSEQQKLNNENPNDNVVLNKLNKWRNRQTSDTTLYHQTSSNNHIQKLKFCQEKLVSR